MDKIALIGGTGLYKLDFIDTVEKLKIETHYGETEVRKATLQDKEIYFMARHGSDHRLPPHLINYRSNIAALKVLEVELALSTAAVGSLCEEMHPGTLVVIDQFMDLTKSRDITYYDGSNLPVVHTDFTQPYCPELRQLLIDECQRNGGEFRKQGTYVTTEGPRFETPAEIKALSSLGGELVGMTNVPEVILSREAGICYATLALVTNFAAGISPHFLTHEEVLQVMKEQSRRVNDIFHSCILNSPRQTNCRCRDAGKYFKIDGKVTKED